MEEILVYALLLSEDLVTEDEYRKRCDEMFLENTENEDLLYLEWETDIKKAIIYIRTHMDYDSVDIEKFGLNLMRHLKKVYYTYTNIKDFADRMYRLWESLPGNIQDTEPFWTLSYADDPLCWNDERQTRNIYENMLNYYIDG